MDFFYMTEIEQSFLGGTFRPTVLDGEKKLVRFSDSAKGHEGAFGSYWMYASEIEEILREISRNGPFGLSLIREVSERWAICDDWGDLGRAWVMTIPQGHTLTAYVGYAKYQPKISVTGQEESGKTTTLSNRGGSLQVVARIGEREKHWIRGPYPTLRLSLNSL